MGKLTSIEEEDELIIHTQVTQQAENHDLENQGDKIKIEDQMDIVKKHKKTKSNYLKKKQEDMLAKLKRM